MRPPCVCRCHAGGAALAPRLGRLFVGKPGASSTQWAGRPIRAKTYGKKREHGRNSYDFDQAAAVPFRYRNQQPVCRFQKTAAAVTRSPLQWKPMAALSGRGALRFPRATQSMARRLPQRSSGQKARHRSCLLVKRPVTEEICWSAECSEDICNALNLLNCHYSRLLKPTHQR